NSGATKELRDHAAAGFAATAYGAGTGTRLGQKPGFRGATGAERSDKPEQIRLCGGVLALRGSYSTAEPGGLPQGPPHAPPIQKLLRPAPQWRNPRHRLCSKARFPDGQLRRAEPVVREGLKHVGEGCVFIYCQVGEKPYWKDPNNDFRKNLKLTAVPTLLKYGTPQKLVESECLQANLVEMLFSED
uniref:Thioredoxin domain containing 17 n=1 Tax=Ovis aries TaxID=9940 RepID=A0AC11EQF1_SHEEP